MRPSSCCGISEWMMPRAAVIHCTPPRPESPRVAEVVLVPHVAVEHVGDGLEAAMRMRREARDVVVGIVRARTHRASGTGRGAGCARCPRLRRSLTPAPSDAATDSIPPAASLFMQFSLCICRPGGRAVRALRRITCSAERPEARPAQRFGHRATRTPRPGTRINNPPAIATFLSSMMLLDLVRRAVEQQRREHGEDRHRRRDDARAIAEDDRDTAQHFERDHRGQQCTRDPGARHVALRSGIGAIFGTPASMNIAAIRMRPRSSADFWVVSCQLL